MDIYLNLFKHISTTGQVDAKLRNPSCLRLQSLLEKSWYLVCWVKARERSETCKTQHLLERNVIPTPKCLVRRSLVIIVIIILIINRSIMSAAALPNHKKTSTGSSIFHQYTSPSQLHIWLHFADSFVIKGAVSCIRKCTPTLPHIQTF